MRKQASAWKSWGWFLVLDAIADGDRFGTRTLSKMQGAMRSNFYEAMIWIAKEKYMTEAMKPVRTEPTGGSRR